MRIRSGSWQAIASGTGPKENVLVYVLQSQKDRFLYIGYTNNMESRIYRHNEGLVLATKHRRPLKLLIID